MSQKLQSECVDHGQRGSEKGYGRLWGGGRLRTAHAAAYLRSGGVVPDGYHVDHLCGNPRCINPVLNGRAW